MSDLREELKRVIEMFKEIDLMPQSIQSSTRARKKALNLLEKQQKRIEALEKELQLRVKWQEFFEKEYINKDKIKEKIEELGGMNEIADLEREIYNRNEYTIEILLELLEE